MTLAPGTTVGRYQILSPLGQGGMATVYKAFQPSLQRDVALKVLRPGYAQDKEFLERFEREAIAIARLRHPHIVQVFDFEIAEGQYVLAMEFLEGGTLKDRLTELASSGRGMDPQQAVRIVGEVAEALSYAHELGIVHRDIKPSNVMLTRRDWAVVTDFGIARILGATSHTQTGVGIGTPEYMAPEQGQGGAIDHRADIYSLGAMAYELLVGRVPYVADTPLAVVLAHMKDPLPLPSSVNPTIGKSVERALLKALAKDREQRFASATDFAEALRDGFAEDMRGGTVPTIVVRGTSEVAHPVPWPAARRAMVSIPAAWRQRPLVAGVGAAAILVLVVGGVIAGGALKVTSEPSTASAVVPSVVPTAAAIAAAPTQAGPATVVPTTATTAAAAVASPASPASPSAAPTVVATSAPAAAATLGAFTPAPTAIPTAAPTAAGAFTPAPTPVPTTTPTPAPKTPAPTPKFNVPAKGELIWQAALDGTANDLTSFNWGVCGTGMAQAITPTYLPGAIQLNVPTAKAGGCNAFRFAIPDGDRYIVEFELSFAPGSDLFLIYQLRNEPGAGWPVHLHANSNGQMYIFNEYGAQVEVVAPRVPSGQTVVLAVVASAPNYDLYVDQTKMGTVTSGAGVAPGRNPSVSVQGNSGSVRILGARAYRLP